MEITVKGEKEGASSIKSDPNPFEGDRIGPSPPMANIEGADVTSESKNDGKNASEVGSSGHAKNGEVADKEEHEEMTEIAEKNVEMDGIGREVKDKYGGIKGVIGEDGHGVAAIDEEKIEMVGIEGEIKDEGIGELNSTEGKDDEQVAIGREEEEQAVDFWMDDDEEDEEDEDGDEFEEEGEGKMEIEDKNVEEVNIAKTDEKMEVNSKEMLKTLITSEDKPESSSKIEPAATLEDNPKTSTKKKGVIVAGKKPESSNKGKAKKVKSMGLIFMCNSKTKQDCYRYKILGLPASKKDLVAEIYKGMRLFLFDIDLRLMYGIYKAAAPGGYNIKPKAFGSAFPSQVRFTISEDCLPLAEEKFKPILKDNYYAKNKFDCKLNSEQVKKLCQLFNGSGKIPMSNKKLKNVAGAQTHRGPDRARNRPPVVQREKVSRGRKRRHIFEEESIERDRVRRQILDEERLDRDRIRRLREDELRLDLDRIRRQRLDEEIWERERLYDRERYLSALPPPSRAYDAYGRVAETVVYVREPVMDRRIPILDYPDHRILDADLRHREVVRIRDPITSYSEVVPAYPPLASSASEYRPHGVAPLYEYAPPRSVYRY